MADIGDGSEAQLRKVHPFFAAPNTVQDTIDNPITPPTPDPSCSPASEESRNDQAEHHVQYDEPQERKRKRRKTDPASGAPETAPRATRPKRRNRVSAGPSITQHFISNSVKEAQAIPEQPLGKTAHDHGPLRDVSNGSTTQPPPLAVLNEDGERREEQKPSDSQPTAHQRPQRVLKLNLATGTIGSPPQSKPAPIVAPTQGKKRGRKPKTFNVTVSYATDPASRERLGQQIHAILLGTTRIAHPNLTAAAPKTPPPANTAANDKASATSASKKRAGTKKVTPKKPAHPFFQGKSKAVASSDDKPKSKKEKSSTREVIFTSTPCSPKPARSAPHSTALPFLGSKKSGVKIPGAQHPAWPWHGTVHTRDSPLADLTHIAEPKSIPVRPRERKAKGQSVHVAERESIIGEAASKLGIHQLAKDLKMTNDEEFSPIAPTVRVPLKHFESGRKLQTRVFPELRTLTHHAASTKTHPAIINAYQSIATSLSAFDASTCESVSWAHKYAPASAHCVLQNGREAELLRDWLQTLKVQSVDTGASDSVPKPKSAPAPRRKRRHKKLEGFVVSSDEEANDLDEIDDDEPQWLASNSRNDAKKTVVRSVDLVDRTKQNSRLINAVLLSGPHGCGKTATVYAIAKELDFEVFEINAGARRSGKDILEKVGDMTRNHLVNHQQKDESRDGVSHDDTNADVKSGKQGMMTSFFKAKPTQAKPKPAQPTKDIQTEAQPLEEKPPASQEKKASRDQKQSLILLEEVDILYEEDKQFWATVISMIAQSKRPFIMTCNNETIVPIHNLKLHGIFRFASPLVDLAVDMLLLIAANEGHALKRHAVETLYESRGHDLRASITELNYWCQIGVGDLRGGFDWFYPRWPKGSDVDEQGHTIRVVSEDTYHTGMGWLNRDMGSEEASSTPTVPDLHREAWEHWGVDMSDHHEFDDASSWAQIATAQPSSRAERLALLQSIERFTESVSESDVCGPFLNPLSNRIALDSTIPDLHAKTLDDFTIGNKVLEVAPLCLYDSISLEVSTSLRLLAQSHMTSDDSLPSLLNHSTPGTHRPSQRFGEANVTCAIENHLAKSTGSGKYRDLKRPIRRIDYSNAFDPIAASDKILGNGYLDPSIFDREMAPLVLDVAPYVRGIVAYDQRLEMERRSRSNLLSADGGGGGGSGREKKRMRTTRAALSALEGGARATTRRERYFEKVELNTYLVLGTGGLGWGGAVVEFMERVGDGDVGEGCAGDSGGKEGKDEVEGC
ncbi:hypothetical protein F4808DRAFT_471113 [Astrocystis sublimbata]|nr:hypothetical protein F4808DRAFT_471113 [Astrocystis sublimbata]